MTSRAFALGLLVLAAPALAGDADRLPYGVKKRYNAIVPAAKDLKWKKIPWLLDLEVGLKQAQEEKRPLVLWVSGDDPLDRC